LPTHPLWPKIEDELDNRTKTGMLHVRNFVRIEVNESGTPGGHTELKARKLVKTKKVQKFQNQMNQGNNNGIFNQNVNANQNIN